VPRNAPSAGLRLLAGLIALALMCETAAAQDQKKADTTAADADLLEFLGSVDSGADSQTAADDGSWIEYLAQTDIGKVAKASNPPNDPPRKQPPAADRPPAPERAEKND
jgi:hypothetical protein